jgi:cell division protein ZapA (FtsZ GTPase activity inhibitor)
MTKKIDGRDAVPEIGKDVDAAKFIDFIKTSFYATLDNMYEIQELSEKVLSEMARKRRDIQQEADKALAQYTDNARRGREEFKATMEQGFKHLENLFDKEPGEAVKHPGAPPQPIAKHGK